MKVLIIGLYNKLGGVEKCIYDYISHIDLNSLEIGFLGANEHIWFEDEFKKLGCKIHPICKRTNVFKYYRQLKKIITENQYDVVHINMLSCANILPVLAARFCKKNVIVHSHNSEIPHNFWLKRILHCINKPILNTFHIKRLACSKSAGDFFYGKKQFSIINNAIDVSKFSFDNQMRDSIRKKLNIKSDCIVIGQVGRFEYQKNHEFSLRVFNEYVKTNENSILLFVGIGSLLESCKILAKELKIFDKVIFYGMSDNIPAFLSAMDIFIFPSRFEGLSVAGIEAQCSGLPIIASDTISKEMEKTDLIVWKSLSEPIENWVKTIDTIHNKKRLGQSSELTEKGFNIKVEAEKLKNIYNNFQLKN